jgi:4-amino-4-deoxy-L-arabinose transferase-like glycosyltransferase
MQRAHHVIVLPIFIATICTSAFLLFSVQPMFAKMVLPTLGGAPAVWAVSLCFFQVMLVAGYGYAHLLERYLAPKLALVSHLALLALALAALPIGLARNIGGRCAGPGVSLAHHYSRPGRGPAVLCAFGKCAAATGVVRPQRPHRKL